MTQRPESVRPESVGPESASSFRARQVALDLLTRVLPEARPFEVRLWDGTALPARGSPRATLVVQGPDALGQMLQTPVDLSVGEAYMRGAFEIQGDVVAVFEAIEDIAPRFSVLDWVALARDAAVLRAHAERSGPSARLRGEKHSPERDKAAVQHHYDVSNGFYRLWLDSRMVYSCAYFPGEQETLDAAQEAKLDLICRKLRLKEGERLLDIGSGWGGLAIFAAQRYGVEVLGVTLSERQLEEARFRAQALGLQRRVRFELLDYRHVTGEFDKVSSVGMAEHVGKANLPAYFRAAWDRLKPGGLMLNHAISQGPVTLRAAPSVASGEFIQRYIFPDGEIVPLWCGLRAAEEVGFEVRDVEDLREHYAITLRLWLGNLERAWDAAEREVGIERLRLWRLYLAGSAHQFAWGHLALHQTLLAKPGERGRVNLPASRADLYAPR